jgi:hypothetical protein
VNTRKVLMIAVLAIILLAQPARGQTTNFPEHQIGLGFNQSTITNVGTETPVYTFGDQLWFESYDPGPANVTVTAPGASSSPLHFVDVEGGAPNLLFTFADTDNTGLWTLNATSAGSTTTTRFYLVGGGAPVSLAGYRVDGDGVLSMNYTVDSSGAYDVSACTAGAQSTATVYVPVPSSIGTGSLLLTLNGSSVSVLPQQRTSPYTFWVELSRGYSYQLNDSGAIISSAMEAALTQPVEVQEGVTGSYSSALEQVLPLSPGEYSLTSDFQGSQGLSVQETEVLVTGTGQWVWLQGCSSASDPASPTVTVSASLQSGSPAWPRYLYAFYDEMGVGLFSIASVAVQPASVELEASGWDEPLTDSQVSVSGTAQYAYGNDTVYLASSQYPVNFSVSVQDGGSQRVQVPQGYSAQQAPFPANQIVVKTEIDGAALSGAFVTLDDSYGTVATATSIAGEVVFYVPPGNYSVLAAYGNSSAADQVVMHQGEQDQSFDAVLQLSQPANSGTANDLLLAAAGIGVVISAIVWAMVFQRRQGLVRSSPQEKAPEKEGTSTQ